MYIPKSFHTYYAQEAILAYLETGRKYYIPDIDIPDELKIRRACFVSLMNPMADAWLHGYSQTTA